MRPSLIEIYDVLRKPTIFDQETLDLCLVMEVIS